MSMCKSSMITGAPAKKIVNWTKVPDEELATDIDNTDSVGDVKVEEAEKCRKEEEKRCQREAEAEQKREAEKRRQGASTAAEARKQQQADSEAQGAGESLEEITDQRWGELIQAVSSCMDVANGHLEKTASMAQSNSHKMQCHYMLMEGLVGQQQLLLSKLVEIVGAVESGGAKGTIEGAEELQEPQGEGSGGQEETEGVPGGVPEGEPEDAPGNEPEDGAGAEDGTGEEGQQSQAKGKGKEKAL
ncbi:hypothetical protein ID866_12523 [Astraeus odoratus]|nr:hypothetical protein ID866_12523 [Astraeus odoratus]